MELVLLLGCSSIVVDLCRMFFIFLKDVYICICICIEFLHNVLSLIFGKLFLGMLRN